MAACGICGGCDFAPFFRAREWSRSGRYLASPQERTGDEPVAITTEYCRSCGVIRQPPGLQVRLDYAEIARDTARQLPDYSARIISSIAEYGVGADDLIIEIGANDGTFLRAIREAGHRRLIGVEPSRHLAGLAAASGLLIHERFFGQDLAASMVPQHGAARAVICRHTLEHVPDVRDLAAGIADVLMPGGLAFIEVPDTDWIVAELFAHEIWDEHITYFRAGSLAALLRSAGLTPASIQRVRFRDTCNLLCWATKGALPVGAPPNLASDASGWPDLMSFQSRWDAFAARLRGVAGAAPKPLMAVGAAHIQLNFLNFTGLDADIDVLIDDDPLKAGRFAPLARPVPIRSTAEVTASARAGTVLRTAFPYPAWEERICAELAPFGVGHIQPYDLR